MPRLLGVDIPNEKRVEIALTYIYGIGRVSAQRILRELTIRPDTRAKDLKEDEIAALATYIEKNYPVEGTLRRQVLQNIHRLNEIQCYRGLPVHGQRTHTNARTRKGPKKTVAGKKKAR